MTGADDDRAGTAFEIRQLVRAARRAALGSIDHEDGGPFASLVVTATTMRGEPVTCLSRLARHSANLAADARASLLVESIAQAAPADILARTRVTLSGRLVESDDADARRRFLAAHPAAGGYAGFADFNVYVFKPERAHLVAGFGRIRTIDAADLILNADRCAALAAIEADALAHMAADHGDAVRLYATVLLGRADGDWRMTGLDPEGADLGSPDDSARLIFPEPVLSPGDLRRTLAALAAEARTRRNAE